MYLRNILKFSSALALMVTIMFAVNYDIFAQEDHGKGQSKGRGDRGEGDDQGNRRNGDRRQDRGDQGLNRQQEWKDSQPLEQKTENDRNSRRQQEWNDRQYQRQPQNEWNAQQQLRDQQSQREQARSEWNSRRQQELNGRQWRQQQEAIRNQSQERWMRTDRRNNNYGQEGNYNYGRRQPNQPDGQMYGYPNQGLWYGRQYDRRDDKQYRKEQKRGWRAERNYEKEQRRYSARDYYNNNNYYGDNYYGDEFGYNDGSSWKAQLLRGVIANILGNRLGGGQRNNISQYEPIYNGGSYNRSYDRGGRYRDVPRFGRSYGVPYNEGYQPEYGYQNSSFGGNSITGDLLNSLPINELLGRYTGRNQFVSGLIANFLAQGYDEGYLAGQSARQNRYGDRYYQDPYMTAEGIYDPYSVSMGENRQILSEGYELGYHDALAGRNDYDPQSDGNVDLVSLLLNNVLGNI